MTTSLYLDAPSLAYRAFFGVPKTITDDAGHPVNAVRGYLDMLATLYEAWSPDEVVSVFDDEWRPAFRVEAYAEFKLDRPEEPPELTWQFGLLNEVLDALGMVRAESPGLEADDAIATLVRDVSGTDRAYVVTGDRDLLCLVRDPHVRLLFTVKGVRELKDYDEAAVEEMYGIAPSKYIEFAILRGDPSDGLPGVPGIGPTRAARLLAEHGSIERIFEQLDGVPPKQAEAFEASREYIAAMRTVVPPVLDAPIVKTDAGPPDETRLAALARAHNLDGPLKRLREARGERMVEEAASPRS